MLVVLGRNNIHPVVLQLQNKGSAGNIVTVDFRIRGLFHLTYFMRGISFCIYYLEDIKLQTSH